MKRSIAWLAGMALLASATAAEADKAIIVLDASGSMWGQIGGESKIAIARETLAKVLASVPSDLELGLMAYGHRDKGSCTDIELIVPPAAGTADAIAKAANALTPKGKTPISDAVRQAAQDLRYTEDKATVILITDGLETCDADPCAVATELEQAGVDLTVHVVGFGMSSEEGAKVACLAENTGGRYLAAGDAASLGAALTETVAETVTPSPPMKPVKPVEVPKPEHNLKVTSRPAAGAPPFAGAEGIRYDVYKANSDGDHEEDPIVTGYGGNGSEAEFDVPAGAYVVKASKDIAAAVAEVSVTGDKQATVDVVMDAGFIEARALATETEPPAGADGVRWDVTDSTGDTDTSYGPTRRVLVESGEATVMASLGTAAASVPVTVAAGATEQVDVVIGVGRLVLRGKRSQDATDYDNGIRWDVTSAAGETSTSYGGEVTFDLASGDYAVKATLGEAIAETPVSVPAGKTVETVMVVASGGLTAHALFAEGGPVVTASPRFDVLAPEADANGERKSVAYGYNDGATFDLAPGKYVLKAQSDAATAEAGFEITGGQPIEVSVVLNAGLLAVTAPGGDRLEIFSSKKDIYGKQASIAYAYGETWQVALPAGDYTLSVTKTDGTEKSTPVAIKAGERTEVTSE